MDTIEYRITVYFDGRNARHLSVFASIDDRDLLEVWQDDFGPFDDLWDVSRSASRALIHHMRAAIEQHL